MRLDVRKIDERIDKLQRLKTLAADPDLVDLFFQLVSKNGKHQVAITSERTRIKNRADSKRGDMMNAVLEAAKSFAGRFDVARLQLSLGEQGFQFSAKNPTIALNGALRRLVKSRQVKVARRGRGRTPTLYVVKKDSD